jgi:hypothetical protein
LRQCLKIEKLTQTREKKMSHYSEEYKEKLVAEMMSLNGRRVSEIHRDTGIPEDTLDNWKTMYGGGEEAEEWESKPENWDGERKLQVLMETSGLNKFEISEYCEESGLYVEQIERWREFAIAGTESGMLLTKAQRQEWQRDKKKIRALEKELKRKDKALAEAAALLVLKKKPRSSEGRQGKNDRAP